MSYKQNLPGSDLLENTSIDFYGEPTVQFHINSGRNWETEEKKEKGTINTTPCPTIDVYDMGDELEILIHLPAHSPIVLTWITVDDEYESFFEEFVESIERGYDGIDEITMFRVHEDDAQISELVRDVLEAGTPDSITVPSPNLMSGEM